MNFYLIVLFCISTLILVYYRNTIKTMFKGKKKTVSSSIDEYVKSTTELDNFEANYESKLSSSLDFDFDEYKAFLESRLGGNLMERDSTFWCISEMDSTEFTLRKTKGDKTAILKIEYRFDDKNLSEVKSTFRVKEYASQYTTIRVFGGNQIKLSVEKYLFAFKSLEKRNELAKKIGLASNTLEIIGVSHARDSIINDLLGDK